MRSLLASPLGLLIGISLGALGGGGSILAVPALVYGAGQSATQATTTSLVLVAITAFIGLVPHWRRGGVRFGTGVTFGLAGVGGSVAGSHLNRSVDPDLLLLAFAGLMLIAAYGMIRRQRRSGFPVPRSVGAAASTLWRPQLDARTVTKVVLAGTVVGALTGFFGVGGGFVIVPALVLALDFPMDRAIGTSLVVIALNALVALSTRLGTGSPQWGTVLPFTAMSLAGVALGSRLAQRRDSAQLERWFVVLLVAVAVYTGTRSAIALG